jgi:DivIVA domain-containing protein
VAANTVVGAVSDAAGKAVPAGVAEHAPPEPYLPGSGETVPAELRLVLGGYVGIACGLFAVVLACATVFAFLFLWMSLPNFFLPIVDDIYIANDLQGMLFGLSFVALCCGAGAGAWVGAVKGVQALKARIRFSRLLRRPGDPGTATVMASKRGGRTLILDTISGGYQPLSEVRLALWTKAEMLMPGERVTVYGGPGGENPLLISSAQRGRAFLGTMESRSTVRGGPVAPLDGKVSGATLIDWAAWAASTTFPSTGLRLGYDTAEVDAFRSAVRDTFLGGAVFWVSTPPVRSDDLRGRQFSPHWPGYDKTQVAAFLEAAGIRLAAMESTNRPAGPLVSGAILAKWVDSKRSSTSRLRVGRYDTAEVDAFLEAIRHTFLGVGRSPLTWRAPPGKQFTTARRLRPGYDPEEVDAFLDQAETRLAAMRATDKGAT